MENTAADIKNRLEISKRNLQAHFEKTLNDFEEVERKYAEIKKLYLEFQKNPQNQL